MVKRNYDAIFINQARSRDNNQTEGYLPIPMSSKDLLIGKRISRDKAMSGKNALFRAHCQQVPKTYYSPAKHRRPHCKQDEHSSLSCFTVLGTRHPTTGDPLH